jgi:hypothetical protein
MFPPIFEPNLLWRPDCRIILSSLARIIDEHSYCNRAFTAATSLDTGFAACAGGGLAAQTLDVLFQVRLGASRLRAPVSQRDCTVS